MARLRRRRRRQLVVGICALLVLAMVAVFWRHPRPHPRPPVPSPVPAPGYPDPPGIVLHDSDTPAWGSGLPFNAARLEEIHAHDHPGWAITFEGKVYHIGYHFVILPNGTVETGRPVHCPGAHTKKHNDWIGICLIGGFSTHRHWWPSTPTPQQLKSLTTLCERLMSQYHIPPERVKRHRDLRPTYCPGDRFPYRKIMRTLRAYAAVHPETHPATKNLVLLK